MDIKEYQYRAKRFIPGNLTEEQMTLHALHGMCGELGEIHSLFQKVYQGHAIDKTHLLKEIGDLQWFVAELCTALNEDLSLVCHMNIDKLSARYPDGFDAERSLHRKEGDI